MFCFGHGKDLLMIVDHIFIFSNKGLEADELVEFGLTEGSGRTHPGIGTANRRFFFENFYLEILWVENESEAKSENSSPLKIWERSNFKNNNYSPYGLCFENRANSDQFFKKSLKFQPEYYPQGKYMEVFINEKHPYLPWFFRLPKIAGKRRNMGEPTEHNSLDIKKLTKTIFELKATKFKGDLTGSIQSNSAVEFIISSKNLLKLEFDNFQQGKIRRFKKLNLEIHY